MGIFSTSSPFDADVEKVTSETSTSEDWAAIMEICDRVASGGAGAARDCLRAVLRRLAHADPHVQVLAATLLDACVANGGRAFHLEVASRDFEAELRRLLARAQPPVARRLLALLRKWAEGEFRDDPQLALIPALHARLAAEASPRASPPPPAAAPSTPAPSSAAAQREQEELARAIALSLQEAAPPESLYPRVEVSGGSAESVRVVRALYDFEAAEDNELSFRAGEEVHVTDSSDPNWWRGRTPRGEGLFPANFVTTDLESPKAEPRAKSVQFAEETELEEEESDEIDEAAIDEALMLLGEAVPESGSAEPPRLARLEARAARMSARVDAALERADTRHARLTQLSAELVDALNLYHTLMRDPPQQPPAPFAPPGTLGPPPLHGPPAPSMLYLPHAPHHTPRSN